MKLNPANVSTDKSANEALDILNLVIVNDVNDYYIALGQRPFVRRQGFFSDVKDAPIIDLEKMNGILAFLLQSKPTGVAEAKACLDNKKAYHFSGTLSANLDGIDRECRYRAILVSTLNGPELTVRVLDRNLLSLDKLGMLDKHYEAMLKTLKHSKGLILVTGPTGAGKSTTLAAMIQHLIESYPYHVVTLEDPVEFIFNSGRNPSESAYSMVSQRSVGVDCNSYQEGLMDALRMKPEVIAIGEIRDAETMKTVIAAAETGHLVIGTMHASSVAQALDRIMTQAGPDAKLIKQMLANNLLCVVAQNLLPHAESTEQEPKRVLCYEALFRSPELPKVLHGEQISPASISELIKRGDGITWNERLAALVADGSIHEEDAAACKTLDM